VGVRWRIVEGLRNEEVRGVRVSLGFVEEEREFVVFLEMEAEAMKV
jgi:hypothetical protein